MSEKEGGNEEEKVSVHHFYHDKHPLTLGVVRFTGAERCYGCRNYIFSGETAYSCREGCFYPLFHEECAEMPREITLSMHPQHTLIQQQVWVGVWMHFPRCKVCEGEIIRIGYYCKNRSDPCDFQIHVGCARSTDIIHATADMPSCMKHPSHPQHELTLLWRPGRAGSLRCDACGTLQRGNSYICNTCQYLIHESCAALPETMKYEHHALHPLSLVYHIPQEYIKFDYKCDVCFKRLLPRNWAYHCGICRYIVHIKCASHASPPTTTSNIGASDAITFPTNNAPEVLIKAFVEKVGGAVNMPDVVEMLNLGKHHNFHNPNHQLRLVSSSPSPSPLPKKDCDDDEDDDDDEDEDDLYHEKVSKLVCDGCTEPIILSDPKKDKSSSFYISCEESECKFYLHVACFRLPGEIASSHIHKADHILALKTTTSKLHGSGCMSCYVCTNGLLYKCTKCFFIADIKCASLPATIKHAAHPHLLSLLSKDTTSESSYRERRCGACDFSTVFQVCYGCDVCGVIFHSGCCLLPPQIINRIYDKHPLRLTFDATVNHPGEFYCDVCEQQMNPKMWMYHCRECDVSIHPDCFPSVSGWYRNVKFGGRYRCHDHPHHTLRFQPLTNTRKPRCDVCKRRIEYGRRGFQCCSDECDFFMCYFCHDDGRVGLQAVDN